MVCARKIGGLIGRNSSREGGGGGIVMGNSGGWKADYIC